MLAWTAPHRVLVKSLCRKESQGDLAGLVLGERTPQQAAAMTQAARLGTVPK